MRSRCNVAEDFRVGSHGQGPDLVLLHGWAIHSGIWGSAGDALAAEYRVHLVDLPGHGVNQHIPLSRDLEQVAGLVLSKVPPAPWVGWSLGGLVALAAACMQPERVRKLVLVGATPSFSRRPDWEWGLGSSARQAFSDGLENAFEETVQQFSVQTFGANHVGESLNRLGNGPLTETIPARSTLDNGLHLLYDNNLLPALNDCKMPTLVLGGSRDRTIRPETFEQTAAMLPEARLNIIRGAGHAPFISHEEKFLEAIRGFLDEDRT